MEMERLPPATAPPPALPWRFDPDTRKLRVTLNPPLSRHFALLIRSQVATGPLPFEQALGLVTVDNAADQIVGEAGIAATDEVQLDAVTANALSPINLEDFPSERVLRLSRPDSRADSSPRLPLLRRRGQPVLESLGGGTGCAGRNQGHLVAGRGPHHAGGQFRGGHHAARAFST